MTNPSPSLQRAMSLLNAGQLPEARAQLTSVLDREGELPPALALLGMIDGQLEGPAAAVPWFHRLLAIVPGDRATRINLANALIASGRFGETDEACGECEDEPLLLRLRAFARLEGHRIEAARDDYRRLVEIEPRDFESWNNLGNVLASLGDSDGAITAYERAISLRRNATQVYGNLAEELRRVGRNADRRKVARDLVAMDPQNAQAHLTLGLAEASMRDMEAAERALGTAIMLDPHCTGAYLELGMLYENQNRLADLEDVLKAAQGAKLPTGELNFLRAWVMRRKQDFGTALTLAKSVPETVHPLRRAQLLAELNDRQGNTAAAFEAFTRMNREALATAPPATGRSYRERVVAALEAPSDQELAAWPGRPLEPAQSPPAFIVGFPRSGTTLIDTMLMNMPSLQVLEEEPVLADIASAVGAEAGMSALDAEKVRELREGYFARVEEMHGPLTGRRVVDKHPLHMARMPIIYRLFPDAQVVLVERHPCDVVLSCFMANFQLNHAMRSFTDLEETARTYDAVFRSWERATRMLPLQVHRVRYERLVAQPEQELRNLLGFLKLDWDPAVLDNQASAARRGHIRTASYSQVGEPIYARAVGRWERYREQLAPVMPILAPWVEKLGYAD